jgi:hypothetical protein
VPALRIVEALNIVEHIGSRFVSGSVHLSRRPLDFERGEEALHRRIVPNVAGAAYGYRRPLLVLWGALVSAAGRVGCRGGGLFQGIEL